MKKYTIILLAALSAPFISHAADEINTTKMETAVHRAAFPPPSIAGVYSNPTSSPYITEFDLQLASNSVGESGYGLRITYYTAFYGGGPTATTGYIEFGYVNGQNYKGAFVSTGTNNCLGIASYSIVDSW